MQATAKSFQRDLWVLENPASPLLGKFVKMFDFKDGDMILNGSDLCKTWVFSHG